MEIFAEKVEIKACIRMHIFKVTHAMYGGEGSGRGNNSRKDEGELSEIERERCSGEDDVK